MVLGIGFYRREQWQRLRDTALDSAVLEQTYDEWMDVLDSSIEKIRACGLEPELVEIDVDELLAYCTSHGLQNTGETRARFVSEKGKKSGRRKSLKKR